MLKTVKIFKQEIQEEVKKEVEEKEEGEIPEEEEALEEEMVEEELQEEMAVDLSAKYRSVSVQTDLVGAWTEFWSCGRAGMKKWSCDGVGMDKWSLGGARTEKWNRSGERTERRHYGQAETETSILGGEQKENLARTDSIKEILLRVLLDLICNKNGLEKFSQQVINLVKLIQSPQVEDLAARPSRVNILKGIILNAYVCKGYTLTSTLYCLFDL